MARLSSDMGRRHLLPSSPLRPFPPPLVACGPAWLCWLSSSRAPALCILLGRQRRRPDAKSRPAGSSASRERRAEARLEAGGGAAWIGKSARGPIQFLKIPLILLLILMVKLTVDFVLDDLLSVSSAKIEDQTELTKKFDFGF